MARGVVEAVMAWDYLDQPRVRGEAFDPGYSQEKAQAHLEALLAAEGVADGPPVTVTAVCDHPVAALIEAGERAELLVVGARGHGGFLGLRLGSVSQKVLDHAPCPVLVVREGVGTDEGDVGGQVVVGTDGSEASHVALRWAAREAALRSVGLLVLHAWSAPTIDPVAFASTVPAIEAFAEGAQEVVAVQIEAARAEAPGVRVEGQDVCGGAASMLIEASPGAGLVVVGGRGRGGFTGMVLGSVSHQVAHHAECPVAIIPGPGD